MKAFLLAAGKGTRLKPYTDAHPKCMIPIHGTPLLRIWIDLLAHHGATEVLINTHHHADQVEGFVTGQRATTPVTLHTFYEPRLLGSAGTVWHNRRWVADESDFIIAYADNLTDADLTRMISAHRMFSAKGGVLTMGLIRAPNPSDCGIVTLTDDQRIINFVEKPKTPESDLANGGIYIANPRIFDYFPDQMNDHSQVFDLGHHLLPCLVGRMYGYELPGYLRDIGNPQAYQQALTEWSGKGKTERTIHGI